MKQTIEKLAQEQYPYVVELRRHFHANPEPSMLETRTQQKIIKELTSLGLTTRAIAGTGVIADIEGIGPGPLIVLRADMDALQITDELDRPYRSQNPGFCHACGHDAHMAMLIGTAHLLYLLRDQFEGTVRLLFQPGEEKLPGGAAAVLAAGGLNGASAIIGAHLWQPLPIGVTGLSAGSLAAAYDEFEIQIQGRGGHSAMPQQTVDSVFIACQLVTLLQSVIGRTVDPHEAAVLTVSSIQAGESINVIPAKAVLRGTLHTANEKIRRELAEQVRKIADGLTKSLGAACTVEIKQGVPNLVNHPAVADVLFMSASEFVGMRNTWDVAPLLGGEDFARYLEHIPGAFILIGCGNEEKGIIHPHHHGKFDVDEDSLLIGMQILTYAALELLKMEWNQLQ